MFDLKKISFYFVVAGIMVVTFLTGMNWFYTSQTVQVAVETKKQLDILPERSVRELKALLGCEQFDADVKIDVNINVYGKEFEKDSYTKVLHNFKKGLSKPNRQKRFNNPKCSDKIIVWTWTGKGTSVKEDQLVKTINNVIHRLPHVKADDGVVRLLLETAAVESHRGEAMRQISGGPARGIYQMEKNTFKYILDYTKSNYKDIYNTLQCFYDKKHDEEWNMRHNVPLQTAMAATLYWIHRGGDLYKYCTTLEDRAAVYKLHWNTIKGKTTLEKYYREVEKYTTI